MGHDGVTRHYSATGFQIGVNGDWADERCEPGTFWTPVGLWLGRSDEFCTRRVLEVHRNGAEFSRVSLSNLYSYRAKPIVGSDKIDLARCLGEIGY